MTTYLLRRVLLMVPTLLGISLVVFFLVNMVPGGPVEQVLQSMRGGGGGGGGEAGGGRGVATGLTQDALDQLRAYYGFDVPVHVRYLRWLGNVLTLDFGTSYNYREDVWKLIKARMPISLAIAGTGFLISYLVCIPLGVYKALHHRTWKDLSTSVIVFVGFSVPEYALGMLLLVLLGGGSFWNVFPLSGITSDDFASLSFLGKIRDLAWHLALPLTCYVITGFATITMLMKNSLLENVNADYVRTALAKGLSFRAAVYKHALRNSLIPIATGFGQIVHVLVASTLLIEIVFGIPGMGLLNFDAIGQRDYPVTLGIILVGAFLTLAGNLLSDVLYVLIDPRISYEAAAA